MMLPQPYGIPGELIVAGKCLASGYLGQKELTDERFIPNPFRRAHSKTSEKMYKSGDLARFLPDGSIECLGRIDTQVMLPPSLLSPSPCSHPHWALTLTVLAGWLSLRHTRAPTCRQRCSAPGLCCCIAIPTKTTSSSDYALIREVSLVALSCHYAQCLSVCRSVCLCQSQLLSVSVSVTLNLD